MAINIVQKTSVHNTTYQPGRSIKYIAIHYTAGISSKAGCAANVASYFSTTTQQASADFVVDDNTIVQYNPDPKNRYTWAVGGTKYNNKGGSLYGVCTNVNSISIEICSSNYAGKVTNANDQNWYFTSAAVNKAVELTKYLMNLYNIPASNVIRHYDVNGKPCPGIIGWNNDTANITKWTEFKNMISGTTTTVSDATNGKIINEEYIWKSLAEMGINEYAIAGIMGNLYAESGLRSNNLQNTYESKLGMTDDQYTNAVDNGSYKNFVNDGAGYGLAQWTYYTRKQGLLDYAKSMKGSIADLAVQMGYLKRELTSTFISSFNKIKTATTVDGASTVFLMEFERPANMSDSVRILRSSYGEAIYNRNHVVNTTTSNVFNSYVVKVTATSLNIRKGPGTNYLTNGSIKKGEAYTIIDESSGAGATKWGKLKSGAGWISLDYVQKI